MREAAVLATATISVACAIIGVFAVLLFGWAWLIATAGVPVVVAAPVAAVATAWLVMFGIAWVGNR